MKNSPIPMNFAAFFLALFAFRVCAAALIAVLEIPANTKITEVEAPAGMVGAV